MLSMGGSLMKKKQSRDIYYKHLTKDNLYSIWNIVKRTCKNKKAVYEFNLNLGANIDSIYNDLYKQEYIPNRYHAFLIFEPKERLVMSQTIRDKIVNHYIANYYLIPYLEGKLIDSNVATRKGKGSSYASRLLNKYFNELGYGKYSEVYCLKLDISKYFYNINHDILLNMLSRDILDKRVINLLKIIINATNEDYINNKINYYNKKYKIDIPLYKDHKGLSIGAMTSQFLAIYYMHNIDNIIKEEYKCKYYLRYMDDLLILDSNKDKLIRIWKSISKEVEKLDLKINNKSNIYRCSRGFTFLGYRYVLIRNTLFINFKRKTILRIKKKLKYILKYYPNRYFLVRASYYGYYKKVVKDKKERFKLNTKEVYDSYKEKYPNNLILVKDGIFYRTYKIDAKILWYLFDYKYIKDSVSFGTTPYDKVIEKLKKIDLSFIVCDKQKELLTYTGEDSIYNYYIKIADKAYNKEEKFKLLLDKVKIALEDSSNYESIDKYIDKLLCK